MIFFKAAQVKASWIVVALDPFGLIRLTTSSASTPGDLNFKIKRQPKNFCLSPTTTTLLKMGKAVLISFSIRNGQHIVFYDSNIPRVNKSLAVNGLLRLFLIFIVSHKGVSSSATDLPMALVVWISNRYLKSWISLACLFQSLNTVERFESLWISCSLRTWELAHSKDIS